MQHPDEGTIHSWLDGALSADETARVEAHVKDCPECAAAVAEARGFIAASSRILTALDNARQPNESTPSNEVTLTLP
jgi:anti-sigma factor RsiW